MNQSTLESNSRLEELRVLLTSWLVASLPQMEQVLHRLMNDYCADRRPVPEDSRNARLFLGMELLLGLIGEVPEAVGRRAESLSSMLARVGDPGADVAAGNGNGNGNGSLLDQECAPLKRIDAIIDGVLQRANGKSAELDRVTERLRVAVASASAPGFDDLRFADGFCMDVLLLSLGTVPLELQGRADAVEAMLDTGWQLWLREDACPEPKDCGWRAHAEHPAKASRRGR